MGGALRYGVVVGPVGVTVDALAERLAVVEGLGFDHAWMPGIPNGPDILTALAVAGRAATRRIEVGSAVVPAYLRHPAALATQALVANDALGGRFTLGVGLSHRKVVEDHLGLSYERHVAYMRDYLAILRPLLATQSADHRGERLRTRLRIDVATTVPAAPPVMLAALGPQMLALAGRVADGVMTWMTGPATLERHVVPAVVAAAVDAGRPPPRVLVSLPVLLTDDPAAGVERANDEFALYGRLPAYRAVLEREGFTAEGVAAAPGDVALVGDEAQLAKALGRLRDVGVTDFQATPFGDPDAADRTVEFLATRPGG